MTDQLRLFHTVRRLKPVQVYGRVLFRLRRPRADRSPAPPRRAVVGPWARPAARPATLVGPDTVSLLNISSPIADAAVWNDASRGKLWLYNLHYFDGLAAPVGSEGQGWNRALVSRWIGDNPPGPGAGWEPYPLSVRLINWIKWLLAGEVPEPAWLDSLATQARWLTQRLERHLLGNHLLMNAKALIFAGLFFEGPEADGWSRLGLRILARELPEQSLGDGGHFELSPMYHALFLEDLLDLLNLHAAFAAPEPAGVRPAVERALAWLQVMSWPDGALPRFNDTAEGVAPDLETLTAYAQRLGIAAPAGAALGLSHLARSGYFRFEGQGYRLIGDIGSIGPSYLPAHGHCDLLSFELYAGDRPIIVNTGVSTYDPDARRHQERGVAAHNTVQVGEAEPSDIWGSFRVGRRAEPRDVIVGPAEVSAAHDGFRPARTRRRFAFEPQALTIEDAVEGVAAPATARFHFHPDVEVREEEGGIVAGGVRLDFEGADALRLAPYQFAAGFNRLEPGLVAEVAFSTRLLTRLRT